MNRSNYLKNMYAKAAIGQAAFVVPTSFHWVTYSVAPTDDGGGTQNTTNGAAAQTVTFNPITTETVLTTADPVEWTASGAVDVVAEAILDDQGNIWWWKAVTETNVTAGQSYRNTFTTVTLG